MTLKYLAAVAAVGLAGLVTSSPWWLIPLAGLTLLGVSETVANGLWGMDRDPSDEDFED